MRWLALISLVSGGMLFAQTPIASIDTTTLRIGEQARIALSIELPPEKAEALVVWPQIGDTLVKQVEVVSRGMIDTVITAGSLRLQSEIVITSFDTGFWAIPPFIFKIEGSEHATEPMLLEVRGVDLGEDPKLKDIRPIHEAPFDPIMWAALNWHWIVAAILIVAAIWYAWRKWRSRDRSAPAPPPVKELPLHERILQQLQELDAAKLWQQGDHKQYHSRLTDLLRTYIEERYRVPAMESTTDELLRELRVSSMNREHQQHLRNMLELADMVKFAKAVPTREENEMMMHGAIRLVQETALHETQLSDVQVS